MNLRLDSSQAKMLAEILESDLRDLRTEISHTDTADFRELLKRRGALIEDVLAQLVSGSDIPASD